MSFQLRTSKKSLVFTFVFLGVFLFIPFYVNAQNKTASPRPTLTITNTNPDITDEPPALKNQCKINTIEENKATGKNCGYSTIEGTLCGGLAKSIEKIVTYKWENIAELRFCGNDTSKVKEIIEGYNNNPGLLQVIQNINASIIEQRPASGIQFAEEKIYALTNPGVVYAQEPATYNPGTGFDLLQPVRGFWGWSVNIVLGFLVIIIIIIAFAIIFRQKLPGNVEVTLQNSIPNIALAMILVPLSYAICGLFIDFITIGSNAVHGFLFSPQFPQGNQVYQARNPNDGGPGDRGLYIDDPRVNWINARSQVDLRQELEGVGSSIGIDNNAVFGAIAGLLNILDENSINNTSVTPGAASAWLGTILNFVLSLIMIWIGVKIFIKLFQKYLSLILMPIVSPFIFATVAIPGNGTKSVINFAKQMAANSLGFIVTYAMFLLTIIFSSSAFQASIPEFRTGLFIPPLLSLESINAFGLSGTGLSGAGEGAGLVPFIMGLIALGIYFSIPSVLDQIDTALGAKFALPQFIKAPIDSFRDATKMTFRAAPAVGARTAQIGAGGARNVASGLMNTGFNIQRTYDRARGIADSDPRSAAARRRQSNIQRRQELLAQLDAAEGDAVKTTRIRGELAKLDIQEGLQGKEFSTKTEEGKERSITATFKWKGQERFIVFKNSEIDAIVKESGGGAWTSQALGEVTIEAQNFTFPAQLDPRDIKIGTVEQANKVPGFELLGTKEVFNNPIPTLNFEKGSQNPGEGFGQGIFAPFYGSTENTPPNTAISNPTLPPNGLMNLFVDDNAGYNTDNGKSLKIKFKLHISNTQRFFVDSGLGKGLPILASGYDILSQKRSIKIGAYSSNTIQIFIQRVRD